MIDGRIIDALSCPIGKSPLRTEKNHFVCVRCNVIFPVADDIQLLSIEDAQLPAGVNLISELNCQRDKIN